MPKTDRHKPHPTAWGGAVAAVLAAAGGAQQAVSTALGYAHRSYLNRLITGQRPASAENVVLINRAVARLAGHAGVESYLDLEAAASDLIEEPLAEVVTRCLYSRGAFFKDGAVERIRATIGALGEREKRKLVLGLSRALQGVIIAELSPSSTPASFQAVLRVLATSGVALGEVVSEQCLAGLAWERVVDIVQRELFAQNPGSAARERLAATWRILEALTDPGAPMALEVSRDGAAAGILYEVKTLENGKQVSRFYGDPRAAWLPFMPPAITTLEFSKKSGSPKKGAR